MLASTTKFVDELDTFDPEVLFAQLPQPFRMIVKVLDGILEGAWAEVERRHPEVALSVDGKDKSKPRDLANVARPALTVAVALESTGAVRAARWGRGAAWDEEDAQGLVFVGGAKGTVSVYAEEAAAAAAIPWPPVAAASSPPPSPSSSSSKTKREPSACLASIALGEDLEVVAMSRVVGGDAFDEASIVAVATAAVVKEVTEEEEEEEEEKQEALAAARALQETQKKNKSSKKPAAAAAAAAEDSQVGNPPVQHRVTLVELRRQPEDAAPPPCGSGEEAFVAAGQQGGGPQLVLQTLIALDVEARVVSVDFSEEARWLVVTYVDASVTFHRLPDRALLAFPALVVAAVEDEGNERQDDDPTEAERAAREAAARKAARRDLFASVGRGAAVFKLPAPEVNETCASRDPDADPRTTVFFTSATTFLAPCTLSNRLRKYALFDDDDDKKNKNKNKNKGAFVAAAPAVKEEAAAAPPTTTKTPGKPPPPPKSKTSEKAAPAVPTIRAPPVVAEWWFASAVTAFAVAARRSEAEASSLALVGLHSGAVFLWDLELGVCKAVLKKHNDAVSAVAFYQRAFAATAALDGRIHFYELHANKQPAARGPRRSGPKFVAVRADLTPPIRDLVIFGDVPVAIALDGFGVLAAYDLHRKGDLIGAIRSTAEEPATGRDDRFLLSQQQFPFLLPPPTTSSSEPFASNTLVVVETDSTVAVFPAHDTVAKLKPALNNSSNQRDGSPFDVLAKYATGVSSKELCHQPPQTAPPPHSSLGARTQSHGSDPRGATSSLSSSSAALSKRPVRGATAPHAHNTASRGSVGSSVAELTVSNLMAHEDDDLTPRAPQLPATHFIDPLALLEDAVNEAIDGRAGRERELNTILRNLSKATRAA